MSDYISVCEECARAGGAVLRDWQGRFSVREKRPADLVTEADLASQATIQQIVARAYPDHAFLGEEDGSHGHADGPVCWIVDPLDGTTNYVHGLPHYCVSVAVAERGRVEAGAVYDPVADDCFTAVRGGGASVNGRPIETSSTCDLSEALMAFSFPPRARADSPEVTAFLALVGSCRAVRRLGSAALNLCYLASGQFDGYWATSIHPWDVAAGLLLVEEAGGVVTGPKGAPFDLWNPKFLAAAGPQLHGQLLRQLAPADE